MKSDPKVQLRILFSLWRTALRSVLRFVSLFFFKSILKKTLVAFLFFVFAYFGLDGFGSLRAVVGERDYEVARQIEIGKKFSRYDSQRFLKYTISNTGLKSVHLILEVESEFDKPLFEFGDVTKIRSSVADQRKLKIAVEWPYHNLAKLDVGNIPPGLGIEIYFFDNPKYQNFFQGLDIRVVPPSDLELFQHELNRSPASIMWIRLAFVFSILYSISCLLHWVWGALVGGYSGAHDPM